MLIGRYTYEYFIENEKEQEIRYKKFQKIITAICMWAIFLWWIFIWDSEAFTNCLAFMFRWGLLFFVPYLFYEDRKNERIRKRKEKEEQKEKERREKEETERIKREEEEAKKKEEEDKKRREMERVLKSKKLWIKLEDMKEYEELEDKINKLIENANNVDLNWGEWLASLIAQYIMFEKYMKWKKLNLKNNLKTLLWL